MTDYSNTEQIPDDQFLSISVSTVKDNKVKYLSLRMKTVWSLAQRNSESQQVSSSVDDEGADFSWQRVDNQDKEERQDDEDDQGYYVFLVVFPD